VYVDGVRQMLGDVRCGTGADDVVCTAAFPVMTAGRHTLELVSILEGQESTRSEPLVVNRVNAAAAATGSGAATGRAAMVEVVAAGLASPTDLALSAEGQLFVTERAGRVHIVPDGRQVGPPALVLDDVENRDGLGLFAVALHPDYERNRYVYLAYARRPTRDGAVYRVVRAREVANTLGDIVPVLDRVPAPAPGWVSMRFGRDKKLYVALGAAPSRGSTFAYNGTVLRLNDDGSTPRENPGFSPVIADGLAVPSGLDWTPDSALWVADLQPREARLQKLGSGIYPLPQGTAPGGIAFQADAVGGSTLFLGRVDGDGISRFRLHKGSDVVEAAAPLVDGSFGRVRCVLSSGAWVYFCTDNAAMTGRADDRILRVVSQ
jgi:glucose/arabinose dehydrogenase